MCKSSRLFIQTKVKVQSVASVTTQSDFILLESVWVDFIGQFHIFCYVIFRFVTLANFHQIIVISAISRLISGVGDSSFHKPHDLPLRAKCGHEPKEIVWTTSDSFETERYNKPIAWTNKFSIHTAEPSFLPFYYSFTSN